MNDYHNSKKARYVAAVFYLVVFTFIMAGTLISQHQKAEAQVQTQDVK